MSGAAVVWFRRDLRLHDHAGLAEAAARGQAVIPLYIDDDGDVGDWRPGAASRWWLHHSLDSLGAALSARGSQLLLRRGDACQVLIDVARSCGADCVYFQRRSEPAARANEQRVERGLAAEGIAVVPSNAGLFFTPDQIATGQGNPYQVFTPFWKRCLQEKLDDAVVRVPEHWDAVDSTPASMKLDELDLLPKLDWAGGLRAQWQPGEDGARALLRDFAADTVDRYSRGRDLPAEAWTSRLSPHLHFGEISPRQVAAALRAVPGEGQESFLRELGWREFAHHLLYHFPHVDKAPLRGQFARFPWCDDPQGLRAWQRGQTGYPLVDAGMRQLWHTGWMHNRVRMVVASFLIKDLLIDWRRGAEWFWDTLVDADLANNSMGWQWVAGCGADAAPFFRIFNPISQGEKFDPEGVYVKRWVPELAQVPARFIHAPWRAPDHVLRASGVVLGTDYPEPIVDHAFARERALAALQKIKA